MSQPGSQAPKKSGWAIGLTYFILVIVLSLILTGRFGILKKTDNSVEIGASENVTPLANVIIPTIVVAALAFIFYGLFADSLFKHNPNRIARITSVIIGIFIFIAGIWLSASVIIPSSTTAQTNATPTSSVMATATIAAAPTTIVPATPTTLASTTTVLPISTTLSPITAAPPQTATLQPPTNPPVPTIQPTNTQAAPTAVPPTPLPTSPATTAPIAAIPAPTSPSLVTKVNTLLPITGVWKGDYLEGKDSRKLRLELGQNNNGVEGYAFIEDPNDPTVFAKLEVRGTYSQGTLVLNSIQLIMPNQNHRTCASQTLTLAYKPNPVNALDGEWNGGSCGYGTIHVQRDVTASYTLPPTATPGLVMMAGTWEGTYYDDTGKSNLRLALKQKNNDLQGTVFIQDINDPTQAAQFDVTGAYDQGTLTLNTSGSVSSTLTHRTCAHQTLTLKYTRILTDALDGDWNGGSCGYGTIHLRR